MSSTSSTSFTPETMNRFVADNYKSVNRNRMHSTILQNMNTDVWMTYELMEASIKQVASCADFPVKDVRIESTIRDVGSAKIANKLSLKGKDADHFFCFHGVKVDNDSYETFKHGNRPDGTFMLEFPDSMGSDNKMVLFYEGDNHGKDDGKSNTDGGCRNAHKFYQSFAQSQSYNQNLAGCTIIAAISRATAGFVPFMDGMFQAHMLAFAVIAHYNYERDDKKKKKETFLGKNLKLQEGVTYDFVIGINMAAHSTPAFRSDFWTERIVDITNLNVGRVNIIDDMKNVADTLTFEYTIKSVTMVFIAVPRATENYLRDGPVKPCFLYPMHLKSVITFNNGQEATPEVSVFDKVLDITALPGGKTTISLRKHMMHVTLLITGANPKKNKPYAKEYCLLSNCDGFFLAALPLAYYTIQQLEFVNDQLNYNYTNSRSFKKVVEVYKDDAFQNSTKKIPVSILSKYDKRVSLFREICESVCESDDKIQEDLKSFLEEDCLWDDTGNNSPVVFFLTMRIFSLQSAMDFAFDLQTGPNEVYSKMLLSYPIGTQIIIKQCMKKLTENGTPAYFIRDIDDTDNLQDISDDEEEKGGDAYENFLQVIRSGRYTFWEFEQVDNDTSSKGDLDDATKQLLAGLLLEQYKINTKWKTTDRAPQGQPISDALREQIVEYLKKNGMTGELDLKLKDFTPTDVYLISGGSVMPILTPKFKADGDIISNIVKDKTDVVVHILWGDKFAQFTLMKTNTLMQEAGLAWSKTRKKVNDTTSKLWSWFFSV